MKERLEITKVTVNNSGGIEAVSVDLDGIPITQFLGDNGSGKTSWLDALLMTLFGEIPPLTDGKESGFVEIECKDKSGRKFRIRRTAGKGGVLQIDVESVINGKSHYSPVKQPARFLNDIMGGKSILLDVAGLQARLTPEQRIEAVTGLLNVGTDEIDRKIESITTSRQGLNAVMKSQKVHVAENPYNPVLTEKKDIGELQEKINQGREHNQKGLNLRHSTEDLNNQKSQIEGVIRNLKCEMEEAEKSLSDTKNAIETNDKKLDGFELVDINPLESELSTASDHNEKVALNFQAKTAAENLAENDKEYKALGEMREKFRAQRIDLFNKIGIPGLSVEKDDTYYEVNGKKAPLSKVSTGQAIKLGVEIRVKQETGIDVVIIDNFTLVDAKIQSEIRKITSAAGLKLIEVHNVEPKEKHNIIELVNGNIKGGSTGQQEIG